MTQFGDINIVESIKDKELPKLTPLQVKQLDYLIKEYPQLDLMTLESVLRLTENQRDKIVDSIKSGDLSHEKPDSPEKYVIQSVKVSD